MSETPYIECLMKIINFLFGEIDKNNILDIMLCSLFFITSTELLVTSMSLPLIFYKQGLTSRLILTILITVTYKLLFNLIATILYVIYNYIRDKKNMAIKTNHFLEISQRSLNPPSITKSCPVKKLFSMNIFTAENTSSTEPQACV